MAEATGISNALEAEYRDRQWQAELVYVPFDPVELGRTGRQVLAIAADQWKKSDEAVILRDVPLYDSPVLIAERSTVPLRADGNQGR